jgi:hypothetical protein
LAASSLAGASQDIEAVSGRSGPGHPLGQQSTRGPVPDFSHYWTVASLIASVNIVGGVSSSSSAGGSDQTADGGEDPGTTVIQASDTADYGRRALDPWYWQHAIQ